MVILTFCHRQVGDNYFSSYFNGQEEFRRREGMGEWGRLLELVVDAVAASHWAINYSPIRIPSLQQSQGVIKTRRISPVSKLLPDPNSKGMKIEY